MFVIVLYFALFSEYSQVLYSFTLYSHFIPVHLVCSRFHKNWKYHVYYLCAFLFEIAFTCVFKFLIYGVYQSLDILGCFGFYPSCWFSLTFMHL